MFLDAPKMWHRSTSFLSLQTLEFACVVDGAAQKPAMDEVDVEVDLFASEGVVTQ
jgi:hypothetical protein